MNKVLIGAIIIVALVLIGVLVRGNTTSNSNLQTTPALSTPQATTATSASPSASVTQEENTVTLNDSGFSPETLTVKAGTTVTWVNKSGTDATVNSNPHPAHTDYPALNLGSFSDGGSLSLTFDQPGTYGYHNHLNPNQTGEVVVQ